MVPYSRDIADQRRKYGDNMLKKADEHLAKQRDHELTNETRINTARMLRQAEREELERLEVCLSTLCMIATLFCLGREKEGRGRSSQAPG